MKPSGDDEQAAGKFLRCPADSDAMNDSRRQVDRLRVAVEPAEVLAERVPALEIWSTVIDGSISNM